MAVVSKSLRKSQILKFQITLDHGELDYRGSRFRFKKTFSDVNVSQCLITGSPYLEIKPLLEVTSKDIDCKTALFRKLWITFVIMASLIGTIG